LEGLLRDADAGLITELFLRLLLALFLAGLLLSRLRGAQAFVNHTPTLLTSVGILGTFVGIVVGLMDFDANDIDASIPSLLDGLKTAFITSLAGMGSAILFKVLWTTPLLHPRSLEDAGAGAGPEEILEALSEQNRQLEEVRAALSGGEETSLVGQLKLLRSDQHDQHRELVRLSGEQQAAMNAFAERLWQQLETFAEMLSRSATEAVVEALRQVILDFNRNLTEQFGENFKALDAAVQKLVEWQENYRVQLEQMTAHYAQGVEAIGKTEASVARISEESQQIPTTMAALKDVLDVNQHQLQELHTHLEAFRDMRDKAVEAVPTIRQQVDETVQAIASSATAAGEHYTKLLDDSDAYIKAHDEKTRELLERFADRFVETTSTGMERVKDGLVSGASSVESALMTGGQELDASVQRLQVNLSGTADQIANQGEEIRERLEAAFGDVREHVSKLLDDSDAYIKAHDAKTQELLERFADRFVETTSTGMERVKDGLVSGAVFVQGAITTGAQELDASVQRLQGNLTGTADQIAKQSEEIRQQLDTTFRDVHEHVRSMSLTLSEQSSDLSDTLKRTGEQVQRDTQSTQDAVAKSIDQMQQRLEGALEEVFAAQTRAMDRAVEGLNEEMRRAVSSTGEGVNSQLEAIDQAMQVEIQRVMTEMGKALAQISGQFTQDYTKLVNAMQRVVSAISERSQAQAGRAR
jgi:uncharacterized protein YukE